MTLIMPMAAVILVPSTLQTPQSAVDVEGPATIVLPIAPVGTVFIVKDIDGDAAVNPITIAGLGSTIDGSPTATIDTNYGSITLIFNGTEWSIV